MLSTFQKGSLVCFFFMRAIRVCISLLKRKDIHLLPYKITVKKCEQTNKKIKTSRQERSCLEYQITAQS